MKPLVWLDLCSGLGGASQPAKDRGWKVIRVDREPRFDPDILADLTTEGGVLRVLAYAIAERPAMVWASSACTDFTKWGLPSSWACNRGGKKEPDLTLSLACKRIIDHLAIGHPKMAWGFENVLASRKFLTSIFGPVRAIVDGHAIWGNFPGLLPQTRGHKWRLPPSPDRAALRAKIPYEIGESICRAVEARAMESESYSASQDTQMRERS